MSQIEFFLGFGIHQLDSLYLVIRNSLIPGWTTEFKDIARFLFCIPDD